MWYEEYNYFLKAYNDPVIAIYISVSPINLCAFLFVLYKCQCTNTEHIRSLSRWLPLVEQELLTLPKHMSSPPVLSGVRVTRSLVFMCMFCRSLFVLLYIFFWPLCCLFFFDIRILIHPLVSSSTSYIINTEVH